MKLMHEFEFLDTTISVDSSWKEIFDDSNEHLRTIEDYLRTEVVKELIYTPNVELIFSAFQIPIDDIQVVVVGQDPYPQNGLATGRAFEIANLESWDDKVQDSLTNILKGVYREFTNQLETVHIAHIRRQLGNTINILPPNEIFNKWQANGVLFLNTAFTCRIDVANSHSDIWQNFAQNIIGHIASKRHHKYWLPCGQEAREFNLIIEGHGKQNELAHDELLHPRFSGFVNQPAFASCKKHFIDGVITPITPKS